MMNLISLIVITAYASICFLLIVALVLAIRCMRKYLGDDRKYR